MRLTGRVRTAARVAVGLLLLAALLVLVWPLDQPAVGGNALLPRYATSFGWTAYSPLADAAEDERSLPESVLHPRTVVAHRRQAALGLGAGAALTTVPLVRARRRDRAST